MVLDPNRFCLNTATLGFKAPISDVIEATARAGFKLITPWRREVESHDVKAIAKHIRDAGLKTSAYCRSTFIPADTAEQFRANIDANKRALDDAATLGADVFVMVVGSNRDLTKARQQVAEASAELSVYGQSIGVKIGLEPLHPVYAADRSCLTTIDEALDIYDAINHPNLGIVIDCYHVWWDPRLATAITRAKNRILSFHVCDWLLKTEDPLNDRGMMGDGVIDISAMRQSIDQTGYTGPIEVEIFSAKDWWQRPIDETLATSYKRLQTL